MFETNVLEENEEEEEKDRWKQKNLPRSCEKTHCAVFCFVQKHDDATIYLIMFAWVFSKLNFTGAMVFLPLRYFLNNNRSDDERLRLVEWTLEPEPVRD